jgi:uncharacterized protein
MTPMRLCPSACLTLRLPAWAVGVCGALLLSACGSSPPVQLYQLRAEPPGLTLTAAASVPATLGQRWALGVVRLPDYLDRDALLRPQGLAGLSTLKGQQWAEPLRDAVPRLLLQDLARLRGAGGIWRLPLPAGVTVARELQVDIEQFEALADGSAVTLSARWLLIDPSGKTPAQVFHSQLQAPSTEPTPDALVSAHRAVLWQLAQDIQARAAGR